MIAPTNHRWALSGPDDLLTLSAFQESISVDLIATPRHDFKTCGPADNVRDVLDDSSDGLFDHIPVEDKPGESVIGLLHVARLRAHGQSTGIVAEHMEALKEEHLLGADASVLSFVRHADTAPFRFVVSAGGITGLVSISDLQHLPVRAALFAIVTHLEMSMANAIRRRFHRSDDWIATLSDGRRAKIREQIAGARKEDTLVDSVLYTQFCDKVTVVSRLLETGEGAWSIGKFRRDMDDIQALRDDLAHANNYAATRDAAIHTSMRVRTIDSWTYRIDKAASERQKGQAEADGND